MTKEERRIYNREYNAAHRDELLRKKRIYQREYARTHKAERKAYYQKNKKIQPTKGSYGFIYKPRGAITLRKRKKKSGFTNAA